MPLLPLLQKKFVVTAYHGCCGRRRGVGQHVGQGLRRFVEAQQLGVRLRAGNNQAQRRDLGRGRHFSTPRLETDCFGNISIKMVDIESVLEQNM